MSRIRAVAAVAVLGAFLLAGIGTAQADNGVGSSGSSNSNAGSGNVVGSAHGDGSLAHHVYYPFVLY